MMDSPRNMATSLTPYHDMHNRYGESLSWKPLASRSRFRILFEQYLHDPKGADHWYNDILVEYITAFSSFFRGLYPVTFHSHASDAVNSDVIAGVLRHLTNTARKLDSTGTTACLQWQEQHRRCPRVAVLPGSFGAGYGAIATICPAVESRNVACGNPPIVIDPLQSFSALQLSLARAQESGAVALIVQIVYTNQPPQVLPAQRLHTLAKICKTIKLPLVVDETLTALRCGAPFAYQREEYSGLQPDLVIFGKALGISGIAVNFAGQLLANLSISSSSHKMTCSFRWFEVQTRPISMVCLIEALSILEAAREENWPERSRLVGRLVREAIFRHELDKSGDPSSCRGAPIGGLDAIICVEQTRVEKLLIQGIPKKGYVRFLPVVDDFMLSEGSMKDLVLGESSQHARKQVSEAMVGLGRVPLWCYICGDPTEAILEEKVEWCRECCLAMCGDKRCEDAFRTHPCIGLGKS